MTSPSDRPAAPGFAFSRETLVVVGVATALSLGGYISLYHGLGWSPARSLAWVLALSTLAGLAYLGTRLWRMRRFRHWAMVAEGAQRAEDWALALWAYGRLARVCDERGFLPYIDIARAQALLQLGREAEALALLEAGKNFLLARHHLAGVYLRRGDYQGALCVYEEAIAAGSRSVLLLNGAAYAHQQLGDADAARAALEMALAQQPNSAMTLKNQERLLHGETIRISTANGNHG